MSTTNLQRGHGGFLEMGFADRRRYGSGARTVWLPHSVSRWHSTDRKSDIREEDVPVTQLTVLESDQECSSPFEIDPSSNIGTQDEITQPTQLLTHLTSASLFANVTPVTQPEAAGPPGTRTTTMSVQANSPEPDTEENERRFSPNAAQQNPETVPDQSQEPSSLPEPSEMVTTRHGRLRAEFRGVRQLHPEVLSLRSNLFEERTALRYVRDPLEDQEATITKALRAAHLRGNLAEMGPLIDQLDIVQAELGKLRPRAELYNALEDRLNQWEWDMKELELKIYRDGVSAQVSEIAEDDWAITGRDSDGASSIHSAPVETTPEVREYLSRAADLDLIMERLAELRSEQARLSEEIAEYEEQYAQVEREVNNMRDALPDRDDPISVFSDVDDVDNTQSRTDSPTRSRRPSADLGDSAAVGDLDQSQTSPQSHQTPATPHFTPAPGVQLEVLERALPENDGVLEPRDIEAWRLATHRG